MEKNPVQNDARRARREEQLGPDAVCVLCGEPDLSALMSVERVLIEQHHALNRAYESAVTVPLCRNCHAKVTEQLQAAGVPNRPPPSLLERLAAILRALGLFFRSLGDACLRYANLLLDLVRGLDARFRSWRTIEAAK